MLVNVLTPSEIDLKPGDRVEFDHTYETRRNGYYIRRIVETSKHTYAVFNNCTWRPITSYGKTWWKVGEEQ